MSGNSNLLQSPIGQEIIKRVAKSTGQNSSKVRDVLVIGLPSLLEGMDRDTETTETTEGAKSIMSTITKYTTGGGSLDNLAGAFSGSLDLPFAEGDGDEILNHVLGDKKEGLLKKIGHVTLVGLKYIGWILGGTLLLLAVMLIKKTYVPAILGGVIGALAQVDGSVVDNIGGSLGGVFGSK